MAIEHEWVRVSKAKATRMFICLMIVNATDHVARVLMLAHIATLVIFVDPAFYQLQGLGLDPHPLLIKQ
jgi:hypothetical protein